MLTFSSGFIYQKLAPYLRDAETKYNRQCMLLSLMLSDTFRHIIRHIQTHYQTHYIDTFLANVPFIYTLEPPENL